MQLQLQQLKRPSALIRSAAIRRVDLLAKHIDRYGILTPLIVTPKFEIVDGWCRFLALSVMDMAPEFRVECCQYAGPSPSAMRAVLNGFGWGSAWDFEAVEKLIREGQEKEFLEGVFHIDTNLEEYGKAAKRRMLNQEDLF